VRCPKNHELRSGLELGAPSSVEPFEIGFGNGKASAVPEKARNTAGGVGVPVNRPHTLICA